MGSGGYRLMAIKQKLTVDEPTIDTESVPTDKQVLDDQTPIDSLAKSRKRRAKEDLQGFDRRLPAGVEREIRVNKDSVGGKNPIVIEDASTGKIISLCEEIKIEGDSEIVHQIERDGCNSRARVCVRTTSSILIKRKK